VGGALDVELDDLLDILNEDRVFFNFFLSRLVVHFLQTETHDQVPQLLTLQGQTFWLAREQRVLVHCLFEHTT